MINIQISETETMMDGDIDRYMDVGRSAMRAITRVVGNMRPADILDLPCGHGRVARHLRAAYPDANLYVSDLDESGMRFCAEAFGATALPSLPDFSHLDMSGKFDLIWVGSLITHLPEISTQKLFGFLSRHLCPNGVAVVTSHGAFVAGRLFERGKSLYGLDEEHERAIFQSYLSNGYGYWHYPQTNGEYGISLTSREFLKKASEDNGLELYAYRDHDWDNHQDVFGLRLK